MGAKIPSKGSQISTKLPPALALIFPVRTGLGLLHRPLDPGQVPPGQAPGVGGLWGLCYFHPRQGHPPWPIRDCLW